MTEEHVEKVGIKATPRSRILVFTRSFFLTLLAVWKMSNP
jgi:hypothetical protein